MTQHRLLVAARGVPVFRLRERITGVPPADHATQCARATELGTHSSALSFLHCRQMANIKGGERKGQKNRPVQHEHRIPDLDLSKTSECSLVFV